MQKTIGQVGELVGIAGVVACIASGLGRLLGQYLWLGYEMGTIFLLGVGLMVMGCLGQLYVIRRQLRASERRNSS